MTERRIARTQRVTTPPRQRVTEIIFNKTGPVAVGESVDQTPAMNMTVVGLSATLKTVGTSDTTVVLKVNGTVIASVTIPSGQKYEAVALDPHVQVVGRRDHYTVAVTVAGAGADGIGGAIEVAA
jgi:hypothetical protein